MSCLSISAITNVLSSLLPWSPSVPPLSDWTRASISGIARETLHAHISDIKGIRDHLRAFDLIRSLRDITQDYDYWSYRSSYSVERANRICDELLQFHHIKSNDPDGESKPVYIAVEALKSAIVCPTDNSAEGVRDFETKTARLLSLLSNGYGKQVGSRDEALAEYPSSVGSRGVSSEREGIDGVSEKAKLIDV